MADKLKLHTLLQDKPWNMPLKTGQITSPLLDYDFFPCKEASDHFKPLVRDLAFDCGELAIVTYLQAKAYDKELVLLPYVVSGNFHHKSIAYNAQGGDMAPGELTGKRVGVRSYAQTTGVWVRGILQNEYGVDLDRVTWVTFQDAHLAEYTDPPNCQRAPAGKKLAAMLLDGEVDAGLLGGAMPKDDRLKTLIPDANAAAKAWGQKMGTYPINHMFVVKKSLCKERPDVVKEIYRMLVATRAAGPQPEPGAINLATYGVEANRKSLELVIKYAYQQKVIPREFSVDELFDDTTRALGL